MQVIKKETEEEKKKREEEKDEKEENKENKENAENNKKEDSEEYDSGEDNQDDEEADKDEDPVFTKAKGKSELNSLLFTRKTPLQFALVAKKLFYCAEYNQDVHYFDL